jgi:ATF/CREB family transcription factor
MFPAPSPNSAALFNSLLGAQTPNTIDFMKTGLNAKAAAAATNGEAPTSQPVDASTAKNIDMKMAATSGTNDPYAHADSDAVNGLFMLAQSNGAQRAGFAVPQVPTLQVNGNRKSSPPPSDMDDSDMEMDDSDTEHEMPKARSRSSRAKKPSAKMEKSRSSGKTPNNKRKRGGSPPPRRESTPPSSGKKDKNPMNEEEKRKNFLERNRFVPLRIFSLSC